MPHPIYQRVSDMIEHLNTLLCHDLPSEKNAISKALETFKKTYQAELDYHAKHSAPLEGIILHHNRKPLSINVNSSRLMWSDEQNPITVSATKTLSSDSSSSRSGAAQAITLGDLEAAPVSNLKTFFGKKFDLPTIKEKTYMEECSPFTKFGAVKSPGELNSGSLVTPGSGSP